MRTRLVVLSLLWVAVVTVGSSVVWLGISRAGQDVSQALQEPPTQPSGAPAAPRPGSTTSPSPTSGSSPVPTPPSQSAPVLRSATWQDTAGVVRSSCRGAAINLDGAFPSSGWSMEVGGRGPERVEVEFHQQGEDGREAKVRASCSGGTPRYGVESDD